MNRSLKPSRDVIDDQIDAHTQPRRCSAKALAER
jgi:hypothetical protein